MGTNCLFLGSGGECKIEDCDCVLSVSYRRAGTDDHFLAHHARPHEPLALAPARDPTLDFGA